MPATQNAVKIIAANERLTTAPMTHLAHVDLAHVEGRRLTPSWAIVVLGFIVVLLGLPTALFALALGFGLLPLPYQLFVVLQRLPVAFPLHMIASGLALILIPIAAITRHRRGVHRAAGRAAAVCVVVGGLTALLVALASEASALARAGFFTQGVTWLALVAAAVTAIRRGDRTRHARLMIAMAAVASGALWLRLVMIVAAETGLPIETIYGLAAWACWLIPLGTVLVISATTIARSR